MSGQSHGLLGQKALLIKANQLISNCGGQIFLMYVDETGDRWIYCPSEELKDEFHGEGISSKKELTK